MCYLHFENIYQITIIFVKISLFCLKMEKYGGCVATKFLAEMCLECILCRHLYFLPY